jgi:hypothetical protein
MPTADRRLQEGARALALAYNLTHAEEALYRLRANEAPARDDQSYFATLSRLLRSAGEGLEWAKAALAGRTRDASTEAVRSLSLVVPVLRSLKQEADQRVLSRYEAASSALSDGRKIDPDDRDELARFLQALAAYASGSGAEVLSAADGPPALTLPSAP